MCFCVCLCVREFMVVFVEAVFGSDQLVQSTSSDQVDVPFFCRCLPSPAVSTSGLLLLLTMWGRGVSAGQTGPLLKL